MTKLESVQESFAHLLVEESEPVDITFNLPEGATKIDQRFLEQMRIYDPDMEILGDNSIRTNNVSQAKRLGGVHGYTVA